MKIINKNSDWEFGYILPNLSITKPIGNEDILLTSSNDPKFIPLIEKYPNLRYLVEGFTDLRKNKIIPSVLITNCQFKPKHPFEALIDFRNIITISSIIKGFIHLLSRPDGQIMPSYTLYSDYFEICPTLPSIHDEYIVSFSPDSRGLDFASKFSGQTSPNIVSQISEPKFDLLVFKFLLARWIDYHKLNKHHWKNLSLFRSLQIAYQACSMPTRNFQTIYDLGTNLALWGSSFEILAHPESEMVTLPTVLNLLDNPQFKSKALRNRLYSIKYKT